jgi:hypothetical protein
MLYLGKNISSKEELQPVAFDSVAQAIRKDHYSLAAKIESLRQLLQIDRGIYNQKKKELPYFCFSNFKGNLRRSENFISTSYLVLDIDKLALLQLNELKQKLPEDKRIRLFYQTPSGLGLKLIFEFSEEIKSAKEYHDLGYSFGLAFCREYQMESNLDKATIEVSRASFLSFDAEAHYNENPVLIEPSEYLLLGSQLSDLFELSNKPKEEVKKSEPSVEVYKDILVKLGNKGKRISTDGAVLSEFWLVFLKIMQPLLLSVACKMKETRSIAYGIQICIEHENGESGEANLYFGKKGYTVVRSNKATHQQMLNEILENIIWQTVALKQQSTNNNAHGTLRKV